MCIHTFYGIGTIPVYGSVQEKREFPQFTISLEKVVKVAMDVA